MKKLLGAALAATMLLTGAVAQAQANKDLTIALIPGLTTDAFYINRAW